MARKLPKATEQTLESLRLDSVTPGETPRRPRLPGAAAKPAKAVPSTSAKRAVPGAAKVSSVPTALAAAEPPADLESEYRRSRAREIVGRFTTYSAVGGLLPLPIVDTASVMACIVKMVQALAKHYGVPFQRDRIRVAVAAVIGGVGQAGAGAVTMSALVKAIPGPGLYASAVASIASAALTRAIGNAFILHFETGGTALEFKPETLREYFERCRFTR